MILSTARKALSLEGASPAANSNCADEPFAISTSGANEIDVRMEKSNIEVEVIRASMEDLLTPLRAVMRQRHPRHPYIIT